MTDQAIELLFLIYVSGPQNVDQIQRYVTKELAASGHVYWMPTDRGRAVLTLTDKGEKWVKEAVRVLQENSDCLNV